MPAQSSSNVMKHFKVFCHLRVQMMVVTLVNRSVPLLYFLKVIILMKEFPLILLEIPFFVFS